MRNPAKDVPFRMVIGGVCFLIVGGGCAAWPRRWGAQPCCIEAKPVVHRQPIAWHLVDVTILSQLEQVFHLLRGARKLCGLPVRALNLREGRVADSAFFTNRDIVQLTPEAVRWGPTRPEDLPQGPFTITKPKTEGKTPGFFVTDARSRRYLLKLDPVDAPELLSGAEVVSSKLLYALGYHVPSYEIVLVRPEDVAIGAQVTATDAHGHPHPFAAADLQRLLEPRVRDGTVRVSATKILEGELLGPGSFKRFRDCAEVRALKVAYAWLNNVDAKDHNSLLVWNEHETVGYVIDFGTSLGADAGLAAPKNPCEGWTYVVDLAEASWKLLSLGLHRSGCDPREQPASPSVGLLSPRIDPDHWKPYAPNLAFQAMNDEDARWIARRMAQLTQAQIDAAVAAGHYSRSADASYLTDVLEQRRLAIVTRYLSSEDAQQEAHP